MTEVSSEMAPPHPDLVGKVKPRKRTSINSLSASERVNGVSQSIFDNPAVIQGYNSVPLIEVDRLPRGGISLETKAVGRVQFGIPPETIKDSMQLGMEVPSVYIVPVERFCREMGPALGINMAEFEFPAYFNYFVRKKRCTLVVDSLEAEENITTVFEETLLGPSIFRNHDRPHKHEKEDFDPSFPEEARPDFYKEFYNFRTAEESSNYNELTVRTLLEFVHFSATSHEVRGGTTDLGVPPIQEIDEVEEEDFGLTSRRSDVGTLQAMSDALRSNRRMSLTSDAHSGKNQTESVSSGQHRHGTGSITSGDAPPVRKLWRRCSAPTHIAVASDTAMLGESRRDSILSMSSVATSASSVVSKTEPHTNFSPQNSTSNLDAENPETGNSNWLYSQAAWLGEAATVYPRDATEEQKRSKTTARVEIFKMSGGTEYIVHDVNADGIIVGRARFSGTVHVPDAFSVEGFTSNHDKSPLHESLSLQDSRLVAPTFHPPSFGVTVLGNSHGFDKNGSTSGYVLWVNGRGIMIDPPPYSSATLEREGIRPQMIMAIIITHCHADHDAGTFQKVMTGSQVAIITTPTIYKSFIRKYSALSGLRESLLRHSHRYRPAIVGQPLRFQGAVFHFSYTLHTIPCVSFKAEWRGKSIVFTGDHMNIPTSIDALQAKGVLSEGRAESLRQLPLQPCDILLHEAGAPPIHTPLDVLEELPEHVKERLYVVHTSAIPQSSSLKVAPTGTAGTIRLDGSAKLKQVESTHSGKPDEPSVRASSRTLEDGSNRNISILGNFHEALPHALIEKFADQNGHSNVPPLVFMRPTDVSDAWFMLNLLSAVPFLSSLSYAHTMEILEIAHVQVYRQGDVVLSGERRPEVLCVFWEGTCIASGSDDAVDRNPASCDGVGDSSTVWHAGDWTGPVSLQPDVSKSAFSHDGAVLGDIVALSTEGVKVITLLMKDVLRILVAGSKLFRKYSALLEDHEEQLHRRAPNQRFSAFRISMGTPTLELVEVIECNSVLRNLTAMQKRLLESLAEGPKFLEPGTLLWQSGEAVDHAFLVVEGSAIFGRSNQIPDEDSKSHTSTIEEDRLLQNIHPNSEYAKLEAALQARWYMLEELMEVAESQRKTLSGDHRDKFANKVLARLYSRRAYTDRLVFSRGHFLSDTSRMVSGTLAKLSTVTPRSHQTRSTMWTGHTDQHCHTSSLAAGEQGCVVMLFPRSTLVPFLDSNPGLLLCLLGTQVVV
eukprot:Nitzschia sp. Nitz4//scaffold3_size479765//412909//416775//NITZ4_000177-RA/size479765-augustus-gene-1.625-mRNA-1//-1//CDS//3329550989//3625//frame0